MYMLGILSDKGSETYSIRPLHSCSGRQAEWRALWSFEHCPLYSLCTFIPENVDMIGCLGWLLTTNVNIEKFSMSPSVLLSKALYALPLSLSDDSSCECVCLSPSPQSTLHLWALGAEARCYPHALPIPQEPQCPAQGKCSTNVSYSYNQVFIEWMFDGILCRWRCPSRKIIYWHYFLSCI